MLTKRQLPCTIALMALLCFGLGADPVRAQVIHPPPPPVHQFFHVSGTCTDGDVVAQADITVGAGTITIVLTNLEPNERSIGQAISDFGFTVAGATITSASVTSATGTAENILSPSSFSLAAGSTTRWVVDQATASSVHITVLSGGQPNYLIAGPSANGALVGNYPNSNASMKVHSPVFVEAATITLDVAGVTSTSTITSAVFSFGTGPDCFLAGLPGPAPMPH
jgi:hypothetical protein